MGKLLTWFLLLAIATWGYMHLPELQQISLQSVQRDIQQVATHIPQKTYPAPSAAVAQLADEAGMTDKAKQIFFSTQPEIVSDRNVFSQDCQTPIANNGVELGCYTPDNRIYILQINNPQLSSQMVVTAAHEMLHAAYQQLPDSEKTQIDTELEADLPYLETRDLAQELQSYRQTEPGQRDNELHSILGTEYSPLSQSLENYYSQYFTNRANIVDNANQFNSAFTNLSDTLTNLQTQILQTRRVMRLDLRRGDIDGYNSLVPQINSMVSEYNQDVENYNGLSRSLLGTESPESDQSSSQ